MRPTSNLLVVTGPAGAGKTTVGRLLAQRYPRSVLIEGDVFYGFLQRDSVLPWLPDAHEQNLTVTEAAGVAAGRYLSGGYTVVFEGVVFPPQLDAFASAAGVELFDYVVLLPAVDDCIHRVRTRRAHGFKDEQVTRRMHAELSTSSLDRRHLLIEPVGEPGLVADVIVAERAAGTFQYGAC